LGLWESADAVVFAGAAAWGVAMAPESFGFTLTLTVAGGGAAIGTGAHAIGNFAEAFRGC
jgi:hypothetical protein